MEIIIKYLTGENLHLEVTSQTTISELKLMVRNRQGTPYHQQRLLFRGKLLDDKSTFADSNIYHLDFIYLILNISQRSIGNVSRTCTIFIKTEDSKVLTLSVRPYNTVDEVKSTVQDELGVPYWRQVLRFRGKVLKDEGRSLLSCDVYNGAILQLTINHQDPGSHSDEDIQPDDRLSKLKL